MLSNKGQSRGSTGCRWPEKDNPAVLTGVVGAKVTDPLIESQQDSSFVACTVEDQRVGRPIQTFVVDGICLVPGCMEIHDDLDGEVLVELEAHQELTRGSRLSSWASSAA